MKGECPWGSCYGPMVGATVSVDGICNGRIYKLFSIVDIERVVHRYEDSQGVANSLVHTLADSVGLRVFGCSGSRGDAMKTKVLLKFPTCKFTSLIMDDMEGTRIAR